MYYSYDLLRLLDRLIFDRVACVHVHTCRNQESKRNDVIIKNRVCFPTWPQEVGPDALAVVFNVLLAMAGEFAGSLDWIGDVAEMVA